jgi:hypothetical protein
MAATMDLSSIRGLVTAFHLFLAGLPRSEEGDHRVGCPGRRSTSDIILARAVGLSEIDDPDILAWATMDSTSC